MTVKYRWFAVAFACLVGAGLVVFGFLEGAQWATLVGGLFGGGGAVGAVRVGSVR